MEMEMGDVVSAGTFLPSSSNKKGEPLSKKDTIGDEYLLRIDDVWSKESPLHEEWRKGEKRKQFLDPLTDALRNLNASVRIYFKYLITMEAWLVSLVSIGSTLLFTLYEVNGQRLAVNVSWAGP
jgi:hypothetical protein